MNPMLLREKMQQFLNEDIGGKDITSEAIFKETEKMTAIFHAKEAGILAGTDIIRTVYHLLDSEIEVELLKRDKAILKPSDKIAIVTGSVRTILMGERVILNLLQRMSGIATLTHEAVTTLNSHHTKLCDTRKTTPGLRMFEKYAVTCGGGFNHRNGLYDGVMIKDNHIAACGSIIEAVRKVRAKLGPMVKIEVETESAEQVLEAVEAGSDIIMFDNCTPEEVSDLQQLVPASIITEASGGITLQELSAYGQTGVDFISLGILTHSAQSLDISLLMEGEWK